MGLARAKGEPKAVAGDEGCSSGRVRAWIAAAGARDVVPTKANEERREGFDEGLYRERNVVERCFGWLKECRRVATRYEKLAENHLAMIKIAMVRRLLRDSPDTTYIMLKHRYSRENLRASPLGVLPHPSDR